MVIMDYGYNFLYRLGVSNKKKNLNIKYQKLKKKHIN